VVTPAKSTYAPSLPAVIDMVIPPADADGGAIDPQFQWRSNGSEHVGWAVTQANFSGPWITITTPEAVLASHGMQWYEMPDPDDPGFLDAVTAFEDALMAQSGTYTLTTTEQAALDTLIASYYSATFDDMCSAHSLGLGRWKLMQSLYAASLLP
jgi:hypothetical protein